MFYRQQIKKCKRKNYGRQRADCISTRAGRRSGDGRWSRAYVRAQKKRLQDFRARNELFGGRDGLPVFYGHSADGDCENAGRRNFRQARTRPRGARVLRGRRACGRHRLLHSRTRRPRNGGARRGATMRTGARRKRGGRRSLRRSRLQSTIFRRGFRFSWRAWTTSRSESAWR